MLEGNSSARLLTSFPVLFGLEERKQTGQPRMAVLSQIPHDRYAIHGQREQQWKECPSSLLYSIIGFGFKGAG